MPPGVVPGPGDAPAPMPPDLPPAKAQCGACSFQFIVGDIDLATCPNCGAEVPVAEADDD